MKIILTGHTSGLGAELFKRYDAIGLSRSNGYELDLIPVLDGDVFINNAYKGFSQVELLYMYFDAWKDKNKLIVNISSNSGDGIKGKMHEYAIHKVALDKACEQLGYLNKACKIVNIRPGYIDTQRVANITDPKMKIEDVADIVDLTIDRWQARKMVVSSITILPYGV